MKKIKNILIFGLSILLLLSSCLKEDDVSDPVVTGFEMSMVDAEGNDSIITQVISGNKIKITVITDADMVAIWPGGRREVMKKVNTTVDSTDMFGHPVLVVSDNYSDYGLVKARGLTTTLADGGDAWYASYIYPDAGSFDLTILATNHGYDGPELRRTIYNGGSISVQ